MQLCGPRSSQVRASSSDTVVHGKMYGRAEYLKIEKPHQLVYTQQFCDPRREGSRHPMPHLAENHADTVTLTAGL